MDIVTLALAKKYAGKLTTGFSKVEVDGDTLKFTLSEGGKGASQEQVDELKALVETLMNENEITKNKLSKALYRSDADNV